MDKMIIKIDEIDKVKIKDSREVVTKDVPISPPLENLSVTPSVEEQVFNHPNSYGYDEVRVEPIPDSYVEPSGTLDITENGEYDVTNYKNVVTNVKGSSPYAPRFISYYYYNGTELNEELSNLDTSNITNMTSMFHYCQKLTSLNLSNFNTSNVTTMNNMFSYCSKLSSLDLSNFDTSNVTDMSLMFNQCNTLNTLDLSGWNTSKVTNMSNMFYYCNTFNTLDLSDLNTSNVTNMSNMFSQCKNLTSLDLSNFNTSKVTNMSTMFSGCTNLIHLDIRNFDFTKATSNSSMFGASTSLRIPADCEIIVKDDTAKSWITSKFTFLTNVKTLGQLDESGGSN